MRVVLDTDVILSGFVSPHGASRLGLRAALRREIEMLVSVPLALEYEAVLTRPQNLKRAAAEAQQVHQLLDAILRQAQPATAPICGGRLCVIPATRWYRRPQLMGMLPGY